MASQINTDQITISATMVKELREMTGAGMMECKKALIETQGDLVKAEELLRIQGQAKADKKGDRQTAEGGLCVIVSKDGKIGVLVEVNCETDFVARHEDFAKFVQDVANTALQSNVNSLEELLALPLQNASETVDEARRALISKIGENIQLRRFIRKTSSHQLISYLHGNRIAALVEFEGNNSEVAKDVAMHIVASNPLVVNPDEVPHDLINKEKEIFSAQAAQSGKPANIIEKMVEGRVKKFLDEVSLVGQPFIKNPDESVGALLKNSNTQVYGFIRFAVGEGIEKKVSNFAEEVMAQVRGS